ncbi:MAG TPA: 30S ribosome-binding factor RbfA [Candidatus Duodenibacillus intestinavium]|nr:30S ribosome-binding factor RbfA [Candidatus Duodenibacillus intestinavium]
MQKAKPGRGQRVAEQIARDLAEIIPLEVRDPRVGLVTITGCEITPDYAHARVFFTVIGSDPAQCEAGLAAAAGMLRNKIFKKLRIHTVPTLHFVHDTSVERGFEMDRVINEAMRQTRAVETNEADEESK